MLKAPAGTTLAFDFGEVRIGVAQGDAEVGLSHPLTTVTGGSNEAKFEAVAKLVGEWQPVQFVVGLPVHADGTEHELTRLSRKFGRRLQGRFKLPGYWVEPCLTKWPHKPFCRVFLRVGRSNILMAAKKRNRLILVKRPSESNFSDGLFCLPESPVIFLPHIWRVLFRLRPAGWK